MNYDDLIRQELGGRTPELVLEIAQRWAGEAASARTATQMYLDELDDGAVYELYHLDHYTTTRWETVKKTPKQIHIVDRYHDKRVVARAPLEAGEKVRTRDGWGMEFYLGRAVRPILQTQLEEETVYADRTMARFREAEYEFSRGRLPLTADEREKINGLARAFGISIPTANADLDLTKANWTKEGF